MVAHNWKITAWGSRQCDWCGFEVEDRRAYEEVEDQDCPKVPPPAEIEDRLPKKTQAELDAEYMIRVMAGELQCAADFVKLHHTAASIKDYNEQSKAERKYAIELEKAWKRMLAASQEKIVELLEKFGSATASGGTSIQTAAGLSYVKERKETTCKILDENAMITEMCVHVSKRIKEEEPSDLRTVLRRLEATGSVELVPKLTEKGREIAKTHAIKLFEKTGEILTDEHGHAIVEITPKGSKICVTSTRKPTASTRLAGQRLLPRPTLTLPETNYDDDGRDEE